MSIVLDGTTGLAGAATGALNGALGATTPSTVVATTITASGVATFSAGSASAPAITTTGDTNTGVFFPSADTVATTTGGTERMRITSSGYLLVGTTTADSFSLFSAQGSSTRWGFGPSITGGDLFRVQNSGTTGVYLTNGGTSWTANSDERMKEIIEPITDGLNKVASLRSIIGKYKSDEEGVRRSFLIAQDVQAVLPEAVNMQDDEQGTLGVQYTDVIPLLVAAIKELKVEIDLLKGSA